ncbi:hypothetical protein HDU92_006634, partial [Lobulomyces angularis]
MDGLAVESLKNNNNKKTSKQQKTNFNKKKKISKSTILKDKTTSNNIDEGLADVLNLLKPKLKESNVINEYKSYHDNQDKFQKLENDLEDT